MVEINAEKALSEINASWRKEGYVSPFDPERENVSPEEFKEI